MGGRTLIIGGSGFVSGTVARGAVERGDRVWVVTRGERATPDGVAALCADRRDERAFAAEIAGAGTEWDLVVDCIGYRREDAAQDVAVFRDRCPHLVFISTDFVFDPAHRRLPQTEEADHYAQTGYGGDKRRCEQVLQEADTGDMVWTVVRPCHIYGPGSQLGCLPCHGRDTRLIERLRAGEALALVGGGYFLQQPIFAPDLAGIILSCGGNAATFDRIFCTAGPDIVESRAYYRIIAEVLGVELRVEEVPVDRHLAEHPEAAPFLCHRIYDLSPLRDAGARVPDTPLVDGLRAHVESLLA